MKKLLLLVGFGLATLGSATASDYVVYKNGVLNNELHVYGWWNDAANFKASNPDGTGEVFSFKPANGGTDASMGLNMEAPQNTGILHNATLNFKWYAVGTGKYTVRLTSSAEENYEFTVTAEEAGKWNTTSLNVAEKFPTVSQQWNENKNLGVGYVFGIVVTDASSDAVIYFDNIYYSNVDDSWVAPAVEEVAPATVPVPQLPASDVASLFSSAYTPITGFNLGYWGQSTQATETEIDGQRVYKLRNFNYLGWELTSNINVSDYDYMHVDFWTAEETPFGFTPISPGPKEKAYIVSEVVLDEWNSYDVPLNYWDNVDLNDLFQIKFDQGAGVECFIANVYFWKENKGGGNGDDNGNDKPGEDNPSGFGETTATLTNCYLAGTSESDRIDMEVTLGYTITYNENKTLTIEISPDNENFHNIVGIVPQLFISGGYVGNFSTPAPYIFTTTTTYELGEHVTMSLYCAYAGGSAMFPEFSFTVSDSISSGIDNNLTGESACCDVYNMAGICIARNADFEAMKSSLPSGIYIVGGKKVIIK